MKLTLITFMLLTSLSQHAVAVDSKICDTEDAAIFLNHTPAKTPVEFLSCAQVSGVDRAFNKEICVGVTWRQSRCLELRRSGNYGEADCDGGMEFLSPVQMTVLKETLKPDYLHLKKKLFSDSKFNLSGPEQRFPVKIPSAPPDSDDFFDYDNVGIQFKGSFDSEAKILTVTDSVVSMNTDHSRKFETYNKRTFKCQLLKTVVAK